MESMKTDGSRNPVEEDEEESVVIEVPLPKGDPDEDAFDLAKTVCSHGFFMMPPNHWDPLSRTFSRPLRVHSSSNHDDDDSTSLMVSISHPSNSDLSRSDALQVRVYGTRSLSSLQQQSLVAQVVRMLRLSDVDGLNAREFRRMATAADNCALSGFGGRVFRSPTLFEDMVKCILLCNCQWPRTLSMARALCELQLELQKQSSSVLVAQATNAGTKTQDTDHENFIPNTPAKKEFKRKVIVPKTSTNLTSKFLEIGPDLQTDTNLRAKDDAQIRTDSLSPSFSSNCIEADSSENQKPCQASNKLYTIDPSLCFELQCHQGIQPHEHKRIGNFPSPRQLANLDERFLAKRCKVGYRAGRIVELAQDIIEGRIPMKEFERVSDGVSKSSYSKLYYHLRQINGFGSFTCANVLMCMGFYHVIPSDSETVRHLEQFHGKKSSIRTVEMDVEQIYGKYAPFQFLAYWAEVWHFYEQRFGKLSEMPFADYKLITASNMRSKGRRRNKRTKLS